MGQPGPWLLGISETNITRLPLQPRAVCMLLPVWSQPDVRYCSYCSTTIAVPKPGSSQESRPVTHPAPHQGWTPPAPAACFLFLPVGICTEFHILPQTRARRRGGGGGRIEDQTQRVAEPLCLYIRRYIYTGWKPTTTNCSLALGCWFCPRWGHLPWAKALLCSLSLMSRRMYSVFSVLFVSFCFNYYYYF